MKKPKFNIEDYFKGKYFKEKKCPVINNTYDYKVSGRYVGSSWIADLDQEYDKYKREYLVEEETFEVETEGNFEVECTHEPIDVGFAKQKLVCKKCDKDLE